MEDILKTDSEYNEGLLKVALSKATRNLSAKPPTVRESNVVPLWISKTAEEVIASRAESRVLSGPAKEKGAVQSSKTRSSIEVLFISPDANPS